MTNDHKVKLADEILALKGSGTRTIVSWNTPDEAVDDLDFDTDDLKAIITEWKQMTQFNESGESGLRKLAVAANLAPRLQSK